MVHIVQLRAVRSTLLAGLIVPITLLGCSEFDSSASDPEAPSTGAPAPSGAAASVADSSPLESVGDGGTGVATFTASFDCGASDLSEVETRICADSALAALDVRLDSVWSEAFRRAVGTAMPPLYVDELRAYQQGWMGGRDECRQAAGYAEYEGVPEDEAIRRCVETAYVSRIARLQADWGMSDRIAGPVFWSCNGDPSDEFVTTYFATEPQAARVERGDQSEVFLQTPTASGARYDGLSGKWFWNKGDSATFVWPRTDTLSCVVRR